MILEKTVDFDTFEKRFELIAVLHGGIIVCDNSLYPAIFNRVAAPGTYQWILDTITATTTTSINASPKSGELLYPSTSRILLNL